MYRFVTEIPRYTLPAPTRQTVRSDPRTGAEFRLGFKTVQLACTKMGLLTFASIALAKNTPQKLAAMMTIGRLAEILFGEEVPVTAFITAETKIGLGYGR